MSEVKSKIDSLPWIVNMILTAIPVIGAIWQGINRIMRHKDGAVGVLVGVLWILTLGLFFVGYVWDIVTMAKDKTIKLFA